MKLIIKMLKRVLYNQQQILENQQMLLREVRSQYNSEHSVANKNLCDKLEAAMEETAESVRLTSKTLE